MKYAAITGSTKGIGKAIAEKFLKEGFFVFVNYATDDESANRFLLDNEKYKDRLELIKLPINTYENAWRFANIIRDDCPKLDVLVLNSGTTDRTPFEEITSEKWMNVMNTNVNSPFFVIQKLSSHLKNDEGRIILIGSAMGKWPHAMSIGYGISKAAVNNMASELVKFFSDRGITVNTIAPGFVDTDWQKSKPKEQRKRIEDKIALQRFADPEEIASLCMEIVRNQYINGSVLEINGGYDFK